MLSVIEVYDFNAILYYDLSSEYVFSGESHSHWELLYVDQGSVRVKKNESELVLKAGDLILHAPNEFHDIKTEGQINAHIFVVGFMCESDDLMTIHENVFSSDRLIQASLMGIESEAKSCFISCPVSHLGSKKYQKQQAAPFACVQMMKIHLETILIRLYRQSSEKGRVIKETYGYSFYEEIEDIILENISLKYNLSQLAKDLCMSKRSVQNYFRNELHTTFSDFVRKVKMNEAKRLLNMKTYSVTEISEKLGYNTVQYFSRQFKLSVAMTPREYQKSIKTKADDLVIRKE
ncbi:AraC family transcriptional regulator [Acidaminobacter sp. JC074]|uniref:AraC family transcriptional regulator n=1 Tax=Acidaminobacter sp. JC074 TaxID=2530199 RepID=UPI001F10A166|nr:AraC family transcriptional regulator [Acidaminobacter sp. JC074]MCH4888674.1 AraC family transcriptional regulator [Acidaminobacter sp. JC074]